MAVAISLVAAASIIRINANARSFSEQGEDLSRYESQLVTVRSAGWSALLDLTGGEAGGPEALDRMQQAIPVFEAAEADLDASADLAAAHDQYAADLAGVAALIEAGQIADARGAMRRADTRYEAMRTSIGEERARANANAARFHTIGVWSTVAATLLAATFVWLISWNTERMRRKDADAAADQLHELAYFDTLTSLPNRAQFMERLRTAIEQAKEQQHALAVLFLDLDNFKNVNDTLGHAAGDELIALTGARIRCALRPTDTAARLGGDEFAVIVDGIGDLEHSALIAERVLAAMSEPFELHGKQLAVACSIGIAITQRGDEPADEIMRNADIAMYVAKSRGKARFEIYEPAMHPDLVEQGELLDDLRGALDRGELVLHYQPIVDLPTERIVGAEALLRWNHPTRLLVPPSKFIPLAEESGLIVPIGRWVLAQACRQAALWRIRFPGLPRSTMAVNVSACQLGDPAFIDDLRDALRDYKVAPESLTLEFTESMMLQDSEATAAKIREIREMGVLVAIDDFGTGYSSLAYLQQFPVDVIKIDRSFTERLSHDRNFEVTRSIVDLGLSLGMEVVAEGIEYAAQLNAFRALGCTHGQGYYFAHPMPAAKFGRLLNAALPAPRARAA